MEGIRNNQFSGLENFKSSRKNENAKSKAERREERKVEVNPDDPYMKWPLRGLAYTNELGEIVRPMSGLAANLLWVPSIAYIGADVMDKYKHNEKSEDDPSKGRAAKQLSFQMLASVILPTAVVKAGQKITDSFSALTGNKLSLSHKEQYSEKIMESMEKGTYTKYMDNAGRIDISTTIIL